MMKGVFRGMAYLWFLCLRKAKDKSKVKDVCLTQNLFVLAQSSPRLTSPCFTLSAPRKPLPTINDNVTSSGWELTEDKKCICKMGKAVQW